MADETFVIGFEVEGDSKAVDAINRVSQAQDRLTRGSGRASQGARQQAEATVGLTDVLGELRGVSGYAAASLTATVGAYAAAAAAAVAFSRELERQAGIFNRFNGNIAEATRRTNGLVSDLQAMQVANRLASRGIQLTGHDMANVMVRITETATATGQEWESVADRMAEALGGMSAETLQQFGIAVDSSRSKSEQFEQALSALEEQLGDTESQADTLGGRINQLVTFYENAKTRTFEVVAQTRVLEESFTDLFNAVTGGQSTFEQALESMLDGVVLFASGASLALQQYMRWATTVIRAMRAMADMDVGLAENLWAQAGAIQQEQTESFYSGGFAAQARFNADRAMEGITARREGGPETSTRTAGRSGSSSNGVDEERQRAQEAMQQSWLDDVQVARRAYEEQLSAAQAYADQMEAIGAQMAENRRDRANRDRQQRQEAYEHEVELANQRRALYEQQTNERIEEANRWRDVNNEIIQTSLNEVMALSGQMVRQLIQASKLSGDAFMAQLDSFLEATAIEYTLKSLAEVANAVAAAARYDYAAAAQHGVAAALAGAVATATGVASIGIQTPSAATGGGGGPAQVGAGATPAGGDGGNVTVNLFAPQAVFTEAERGQIVAEGLRAARREGGPGAVRG